MNYSKTYKFCRFKLLAPISFFEGRSCNLINRVNKWDSFYKRQELNMFLGFNNTVNKSK